MARSSLGFLTAMVLTRESRRIAPMWVLPAAGAGLAGQVHQKEGMPRTRPAAMVDP